MVYSSSYADRRAALLRKVSKNSTYIIEKKEVQEARLRHEFWKNRISKKKGKLSSRFSPPHFIPRSPSHIHHDVEDTTCPLLSRNKRLRALSRWWRCNNHSSSSEEPNGVSRVCRKAERLLVGERVNKKKRMCELLFKKTSFCFLEKVRYFLKKADILDIFTSFLRWRFRISPDAFLSSQLIYIHAHAHKTRTSKKYMYIRDESDKKKWEFLLLLCVSSEARARILYLIWHLFNRLLWGSEGVASSQIQKRIT